jgi:CDP-4-dehydro-6-deoxyglucose reductase
MSFNVRLAGTGHEFNTQPGETLLDAALRQGLNLPYGCRNGRCGTCIATLVSGSVEYPSGKTEALEGRPDNACLVCQAVPLSDLTLEVREVEAVKDLEIRILPCRADLIERLNHDVLRMYLKLPDGQRLQFLAGQYLEFILANGHRRAFSIANAPHDDRLIELHIRHVTGGEFTDYVFDRMKEKAILRIQAPLGSFYLREDSERPIILVGGGTGFAPLKGIIEHAFHLGVDRPMHLFWGVRSRRDLYLPQLPEQWVADHPNFRYTPVLSEADPDWEGETGWVHEAVLREYPDMSPFDLYMGGPPPMIIAAREAFATAGLSPTHMYYDSFEYGAATDPDD